MNPWINTGNTLINMEVKVIAEKSLYERLGGVFAIAPVVNYFSDEIIKDPIAGATSKNPDMREWHTKQLGRLPGLKFMRTLWVWMTTRRLSWPVPLHPTAEKYTCSRL